MGGYDGDVLFENLELIRTVAGAPAAGSAVPPGCTSAPAADARGTSAAQRVRQAYDSFAQPGRLAVELAVLPAVGWLAVARAPARRALRRPGLAGVVGLAEAGAAARAGGAAVFPADAALWAPLWLGERAVCSWLAVLARLRGGVPYRDRRLLSLPTPPPAPSQAPTR